MLDRWLRPVKERLLVPVARPVARVVSADVVSGVAFAAGAGAAVAAATGRFGLALTLWLVNRVLDGLDGTVARLRGTATDVGGHLDIVLDTAVYGLLPLGVAAHTGHEGAWAAAAVLLFAFYVNTAAWMYLAAVLEKRGAGAAAQGEMTTVTMPTGLVEGTEAVVFFSLLLLLPGHAPALMGAMAVLVLLAAAQRLRWARRHL